MQEKLETVFGAKIVVHIAKHKWLKFEPLRRNYKFPYEFKDFLEENEKILDYFIRLEFRGCMLLEL